LFRRCSFQDLLEPPEPSPKYMSNYPQLTLALA
jgi:hypothetical protein